MSALNNHCGQRPPEGADIFHIKRDTTSLIRRALTRHQPRSAPDTERHGMRLSELQNYPETIPDESGPGAPALAVVTATQSTSTTERSSGANFGRPPFRRTARSRPPYTIEIHPEGQFCSLAVSGFEATTVSEQCAIVLSRSPSKKRTRTGPGGVSLWGLAEVATGPRACGGLGRRGSRRRVPFSPAPVARARGEHLGLEVAHRTLRTQSRRQCADTSVPDGPV